MLEDIYIVVEIKTAFESDGGPLECDCQEHVPAEVEASQHLIFGPFHVQRKVRDVARRAIGVEDVYERHSLAHKRDRVCVVAFDRVPCTFFNDARRPMFPSTLAPEDAPPRLRDDRVDDHARALGSEVEREPGIGFDAQSTPAKVSLQSSRVRVMDGSVGRKIDEVPGTVAGKQCSDCMILAYLSLPRECTLSRSEPGRAMACVDLDGRETWRPAGRRRVGRHHGRAFAKVLSTVRVVHAHPACLAAMVGPPAILVAPRRVGQRWALGGGLAGAVSPAVNTFMRDQCECQQVARRRHASSASEANDRCAATEILWTAKSCTVL